jgi:hypothetical protein
MTRSCLVAFDGLSGVSTLSLDAKASHYLVSERGKFAALPGLTRPSALLHVLINTSKLSPCTPADNSAPSASDAVIKPCSFCTHNVCLVWDHDVTVHHRTLQNKGRISRSRSNVLTAIKHGEQPPCQTPCATTGPCALLAKCLPE